MELKEYFRIVKLRLIWIVACTILVGSITAYVSYNYVSSVYEANVKLIVNKSSNALDDYKLDINEVNTNIRLINTYKEIMKTRAIMDKVVIKYPELQIKPGQLMNLFSVSSVNDTQVMTISVRDKTYKRAAAIANAISKVFQSEIVSIYKVDNVIILSDANLEDRPAPITPKPINNIIISIVVALLAMIGLVFIVHHLDETVKTEKDVAESLGLPTLAFVAKAKQKDYKAPSSSNKNRPLKDAPAATMNS